MRVGGVYNVNFGTTYHTTICVWIIQADPGYLVQLNISEFLVRQQGLNYGRTGRFKIGNGDDVNADQYILIIGDYPSIVTSSTNKIWMKQEPEGEQIITLQIQQINGSG